MLVKRATAEVHATHSVAHKRMYCGIERLIVTCPLREMQILACKHCLTGGIIGIHALPSSRKCTAMEHYKKTVVIGIGKNIVIQTHGLLLVTAEEIHFYASYPVLLHPCHIFATLHNVVHNAARSLGRIVP